MILTPAEAWAKALAVTQGGGQGARFEFLSAEAAVHFTARMYGHRISARTSNRKFRQPEDPLYGTSPWDHLMIMRHRGVLEVVPREATQGPVRVGEIGKNGG